MYYIIWSNHSETDIQGTNEEYGFDIVAKAAIKYTGSPGRFCNGVDNTSVYQDHIAENQTTNATV